MLFWNLPFCNLVLTIKKKKKEKYFWRAEKDLKNVSDHFLKYYFKCQKKQKKKNKNKKTKNKQLQSETFTILIQSFIFKDTFFFLIYLQLNIFTGLKI